MSKQKPTYRIAPPGDCLRIWGTDGHALAAEPRGGGGMLLMSNSFGEQSMMTIARSIYKAPQQETDRGGGYVLVRYAP